MSAPHIHALSSVKKYGGKVEDYIEIHAKMDCSKGYMPDNRHRALNHTMFWILEVMVPIFGHTITNSDGKVVSVKDVCEFHVLEDYGMKFIPTPQDFLQHTEFKDWMQNGRGTPPSAALLYKKKKPDISEILKEGAEIDKDKSNVTVVDLTELAKLRGDVDRLKRRNNNNDFKDLILD